MTRTITLPDDVTAEYSDGTIIVSSGDRELERELDHPAVDITVEDDTVTVGTDSERRDDAAIVGTYAAHIQNMVDGVTSGFTYKMKGFYNHFPMDFNVQGDEFVIKNFIGERSPRRIPIPDSVDVEVDGEDVLVSGPDKEQVGQTAANIEQACYKGNRDPRKFQDGIYLTEKGVTANE